MIGGKFSPESGGARISSVECPANTILVRRVSIGKIERTACEFTHTAARIL
jgi:hypothetical protein